MNPSKGNVLVFQLDAYGGPLGGNRSYTKYDLDFRQYASFFKNITIVNEIKIIPSNIKCKTGPPLSLGSKKL